MLIKLEIEIGKYRGPSHGKTSANCWTGDRAQCKGTCLAYGAPGHPSELSTTGKDKIARCFLTVCESPPLLDCKL